jgi:cell division protein ZapB
MCRAHRARRLTAAEARHYSFLMMENVRSPVEQELGRLERRLEELVASIQALREENRALRQRQESLAAERSGLLQKNEQVRTRVEAMIGRLKTLEHGA